MPNEPLTQFGLQEDIHFKRVYSNDVPEYDASPQRINTQFSGTTEWKPIIVEKPIDPFNRKLHLLDEEISVLLSRLSCELTVL